MRLAAKLIGRKRERERERVGINVNITGETRDYTH